MVPTAQNFVYKRVQGVDIDVDVYHTASSAPSGKSPVVIFLHGGGFVLGNKNAIPRYLLEEVTKREWILVSANYRLAPQAPLKEIYEDVVDVVTWTREELPKLLNNSVDAEKISLWGSSAGGTLALLAGAYCKIPPSALVAFYPATDFSPTAKIGSSAKNNSLDCLPEELKEVAQTPPVVVETPFVINPATGGPDFQKSASHPRYQLFAFANKNGCSLQMMTGINPNSEAEIPKFKDISPLNQIHANYPPTYLVHGDADTMVIPEHSLNMTKALEKAERKVRLEMVPKKNHVFDFDIRHGTEEYQTYIAPIFDFLELEFGLAK
ncbi:hypothetical protein K7432_002232 [Basidiobolus ranarum]|uniref:BD-FAE-like domain-containing protein n=1 Tax=Basidiobolus ranarum TaxID=34480 RepID=A0ABR2W8B6_9FUNG